MSGNDLRRLTQVFSGFGVINQGSNMAHIRISPARLYVKHQTDVSLKDPSVPSFTLAGLIPLDLCISLNTVDISDLFYWNYFFLKLTP